MIKKVREPWPWPDYPEGIAPPGQYWNPKWNRRLSLRPQRAGRIGVGIVRIKNGSIEGRWAIYPNNYLLGSPTAIKPTRAQAAQAANG